MKWIITRDHTEANQQRSMVGTNRGMGADRRGVVRALPTEALQPFLAEVVKGLNYEFQLRDDDGNPMVDGYCLDLDDQDGDSAFEPLDHFMGIYGATEMHYRKVGATKWEPL